MVDAESSTEKLKLQYVLYVYVYVYVTRIVVDR